MDARQIKRIVWAVDPFMEDKQFLAQTAIFLKQFAEGVSAALEPVYILGPGPMKIAESFFTREQSLFLENTQRTIREWEAGLSIEGLAPAVILVQNSQSMRTAVHHLIDHAKERDADLIFVGTGGKKGVSQFLLGSFAETLILASDIPIMVTNPTVDHAKPIKNILFPSSLTAKSQESFGAVVGLAKQLAASITIFHKIEYVSQATIAHFSPDNSYEQFLKEDAKGRQQSLDLMVESAAKLGVKATTILCEAFEGVTDSIGAHMKKNPPDLLALASSVGPGVGTLLGIHTRHLVRSAVCPTWVIHES